MDATAGKTEPARMRSVLEGIWRRNQPLFLSRVELLERAAKAAEAGSLDASLQAEAGETAHKLAGSLGMFGFPEGTVLARELELGLEAGTVGPERLREIASGLRAMLFPEGQGARTELTPGG